MSVFVLLSLGFCDYSNALKMLFDVPYDHKYPLCTLVSKSNVTLAQSLRLKIM